MIDIGRFFAERRYSTVVLLIALFATVLVLYISWPWVWVIFLALWASYILWFPARWLERRIHRRALSSFLILLLVIVLYLVMIFQVFYILASDLTTFSVATGTASTTLSTGFAHFLGVSGVPAVTNVTADAGHAGSSILTAFVNAALGIIQGIIKSTPLLIFQLFIVTLLVWYLLVNGDHIVAEFKSLAPRDHQDTVNAFLGHLNAIYHALYVNYILAGVISGIIAFFFFPIIGVPYAFTCAFLMLTIGIIPIIGRALVYVPVSLYFLVIGDPLKALWVLIVSIIIFQVIIGIFLIPYLGRRGRAGIPKPVALLAYVIPFAALGLIGVIIGPAVYGFALALYRTYQDKRREEDALAAHPSSAEASPP
ncbi:MAG: AI-2E family transporter [Halobacteriota archaeon]|jgi:predicted PurR-regulated permease PerM